MQMRVDDTGNVARDVLRVRRRAQIVDLGPCVDHPGVDEHEPGRVVDRPDEHGPALALDEQLGPEQWRDRGRRYHQSTSYRRYDSRRKAKSSLRINRRRGCETRASPGSVLTLAKQV